MYYDEKARWNLQMETQKSHINEIEQSLIHTKRMYKEAMTNLSKISEEIHNRRKLDKMVRRKSELNETTFRADSQQSSETVSLSNESQSSETESKKLKTFLNYYNLTLPDNGQSSMDIARQNSDSSNTTKTYDELKNYEASEYISLGLNSTASNSRSDSPSNSMDNDIDWNKTIENNEPEDLTVVGRIGKFLVSLNWVNHEKGTKFLLNQIKENMHPCITFYST